MNIPIHEITAGQFTMTLKNLKKILEKAHDFADSKKIDMAVLFQSRLIADQFPLGRQIQIASDTAKMCVGRLANIDIPVFEDNEKTYEEYIERIDKTIAFLKKAKPEQFKNFETAKHTSKFRPGQVLDGRSYLVQHAIPNFYFHVTTAYSILRANGVSIGKADYLGDVNWAQE